MCKPNPEELNAGDLVFVSMPNGRPLAATVVTTNKKYVWVKTQRGNGQGRIEKCKRVRIRLWKARNEKKRGNK